MSLRFARAVNKVLRPQILHLPTQQQMWENASKIEEKYNLSGFMGGIDGTFLLFDGKPRFINFML